MLRQPFLPSLTQSLTVVLSHPSILVLLWRENSSTTVEFPSPVSSEEGSAGCPDQTGPQCGAESSLKTRADPSIKDSPRGHSSWKFYFSKAQILLLPREFVCVRLSVCTCVSGFFRYLNETAKNVKQHWMCNSSSADTRTNTESLYHGTMGGSSSKNLLTFTKMCATGKIHTRGSLESWIRVKAHQNSS